MNECRSSRTNRITRCGGRSIRCLWSPCRETAGACAGMWLPHADRRKSRSRDERAGVSMTTTTAVDSQSRERCYWCHSGRITFERTTRKQIHLSNYSPASGSLLSGSKPCLRFDSSRSPQCRVPARARCWRRVPGCGAEESRGWRATST